MRKQDLKVGEEYAVFLDPSAARSKYSRSEPMRAKLVAIEGTVEDTFTIRKRDGIHGKLTEEQQMVAVKGIVVQLLDEPIERDVPKVGWIGSFGYGGRGFKHIPSASVRSITNYEGKHLRRHEGEEPEFETRTYHSIVLENAGCFKSTWADHLADVEAQKQAARERKARARARLEEEAGNDSALREQVKTLVDRLTSLGYEVDVRSIERDNSDPYVVYVERDGANFELDLDYADHGKNGNKLVQARVRKLTVAELLHLLDL